MKKLTKKQIIKRLEAVDNNFSVSAKALAEALSRVGTTSDGNVPLDKLNKVYKKALKTSITTTNKALKRAGG